MGLLFISTNEPGRFSSFQKLKSKSLCQSFGHLFGHNSPIRVCQEWKWQMSRLCQSWNFDETIFKGENSPQKNLSSPSSSVIMGKNSFSNMIYHHHRTHVTLSINWKIATTFKLPNSWGYTVYPTSQKWSSCSDFQRFFFTFFGITQKTGFLTFKSPMNFLSGFFVLDFFSFIMGPPFPRNFCRKCT